MMGKTEKDVLKGDRRLQVCLSLRTCWLDYSALLENKWFRI